MENRENNIDQLIKKHFKDKMANTAEPSLGQDCPSELELSDYLEGRLSKEKRTQLLEHIADCSHCLSLLGLAEEAAKEKAQGGATAGMIMRAKSIAQKRSKNSMLNYKWPTLASISFILSFILTRYFLQFLVLAVVFSTKWIFDTGSTRTLIMIYEAWRKKEKGTARRIIQDFQDKIEQRR